MKTLPKFLSPILIVFIVLSTIPAKPVFASNLGVVRAEETFPPLTWELHPNFWIYWGGVTGGSIDDVCYRVLHGYNCLWSSHYIDYWEGGDPIHHVEYSASGTATNGLYYQSQIYASIWQSGYTEYGVTQIDFSEGNYTTYQIGDPSDVFTSYFDAEHIGSTHPFIFKSGITGHADFLGITKVRDTNDFTDCADAYAPLATEAYEINPTIEFPVGDPTDEQISDVVQGQVYKIVVNGNWNDNETNPDRSDMAYSWDGTTWFPLDETASELTCIDPSTFYLTAASNEFYIRVNDTPGNFSDNTISTGFVHIFWTISMEFQTGPLECTDQFSYDPVTDFVASLPVHANNGEGVGTDDGDITVGSWYVLETAGGPWHNGSEPTDLYDLQGDWPYDDWWDFSDSDARGVTCIENLEDGKHVRLYVQAPVSMFFARVKDPGGNFADNTGGMGINIYKATYTRYPSPCESWYTVDETMRILDIDPQAPEGSYVDKIAMPGDMTPGPDGTGSIYLIPGNYYQLVTTNGPWYYKGVGHGDFRFDNYDLEIKDNSGDWKDLADWDGAECIAQLDELGHLSVFFTIPDSDYGAEYRLRVNDTSWSGNSGNMGFILYSVRKDDVPPGGDCGEYSYNAETDLLYSTTVDATLEAGAPMQTEMLTYGNVYAIKITNGPWHEQSGGGDEWDMQIKSVGGGFPYPGNTWYDLVDWPYTLCPETSEHDITIYFKAEFGQGGINVRVASESFANNTGSRTASLYNASHINGPVCFQDKRKNRLFEEVHVNEKSDTGVYVGHPNTSPGITPGNNYGIETKNNWYDNGTQSDKLEVSSDAGATWYEIKDHPNVTCSNYIIGQTLAEFHVDTGEVWRIRVKDQDGNWGNNTGAEGYILYSLDDANIPPPTPGGDPPPPSPETDWACNGSVIKPTFSNTFPTFETPGEFSGTDILNLGNYLGEWITASSDYISGYIESLFNVSAFIREYIYYASLAIQQYFAWCPRHTEAILALPSMFTLIEPFGSIAELGDVVDETRQAVDGYSTGDGGQGLDADRLKPQSVFMPSGGQTSQVIDILTSLPASSPYNNGRINIRNTGARVYVTSCHKSLIPAIGTKLGAGICFAADMMVSTGVSIWMQVIFELSLLICFVVYLFKTWILKIQQ